jgi:DNA-binding Lrp family transcriptional regulator
MSKFYPLEHEAFKEMRSQLTPAQKDILLYLRTLDPFGDRHLDIGIRELGREMGLSHSTVSRAMEVLRDKGYIEMETTHVRVKIKSLGMVPQSTSGELVQKQSCGKVVPPRTSGVSTDQKRSQCTKVDPNAPKAIAMHHLASESQEQQGVQNSKTIKTINTDQIRSKDENFELKNHELEAKVNQEIQIQETKDDDPDKDLKKFIIKTVEKQKGIQISNAVAYAAKCLEKDRNHWRSLYLESLRPKPKTRDVITEDIWRLEQSLSSAIKMRDYEFAIAKLEKVPEMAEQIFEKHPEWRKLLCHG